MAYHDISLVSVGGVIDWTQIGPFWVCHRSAYCGAVHAADRHRGTVEDLVTGMMELHGDRDNPTQCGSRHRRKPAD